MDSDGRSMHFFAAQVPSQMALQKTSQRPVSKENCVPATLLTGTDAVLWGERHNKERFLHHQACALRDRVMGRF